MKKLTEKFIQIFSSPYYELDREDFYYAINEFIAVHNSATIRQWLLAGACLVLGVWFIYKQSILYSVVFLFLAVYFNHNSTNHSLVSELTKVMSLINKRINRMEALLENNKSENIKHTMIIDKLQELVSNNKDFSSEADDDREELLEEIERLKEEKDYLINIASTNEKNQEILESIGFSILSCKSLPDLIQKLFDNEYVKKWWTTSQLILVNNLNINYSKLLSDDSSCISQYKNKVIVLDSDNKDEIDKLSDEIEIGEVVINNYKWIIDKLEKDYKLNNGAYLPLYYKGDFIGALLLGSKMPGLFSESQSTYLIEKFANFLSFSISSHSSI